MKIDLLTHLKNETIWEDSFWTFQATIMECLTLNSPIVHSNSPDDIMVRNFESLTMKRYNPVLFTQITIKFNMTEIDEIFSEVHQKHQSLMIPLTAVG